MADVTVIAPRRASERRLAIQEMIPKLVLAPSFALILLFVYGFILFTSRAVLHRLEAPARFQHLGRASAITSGCSRIRTGSRRSRISRSSHRSTSSSAASSASGSRSCSIRKSAAKVSSGPSISIRWRFPSSSPAWPGSGSSTPVSGLNTSCTRSAGRASHSDWIKEGKYAIYTIVIAAVWQSSGFVMAMFLAGLRGVDNEVIKAAQIDGASTFTIYRRIIIPLDAPGVPFGFRGARASRDQVLRSRRRA